MEDWIATSNNIFKYQMLDRMRQDCDYYLGYGNRGVKSLWAQDEKRQIEIMKDIWNSFSDNDKPEWLTWGEILEYERKMCK